MKLNDRALLVQLSISQWTARKYDRRATVDAVSANDATMAAGRFNKALLPMATTLGNIQRKSTLIRQHYYANTLPWGLDGTQMLPVKNYLPFTRWFSKARAEWRAMVSTFVTDYPAQVEAAKGVLGTLYDPQDYPDVASVAARFDMDLSVMPVPTTDFRVELADAELEAIKAGVTKRVAQAEAVAMQEAWNRLYERVKHMAERLSDPKGIFRDTMVENTRELCGLLTRLNFADDPQLETMRQDVEQSLLKAPEALRHDPVLREDTAAEAQRILDSMNIMMGAQ